VKTKHDVTGSYWLQGRNVYNTVNIVPCSQVQKLRILPTHCTGGCCTILRLLLLLLLLFSLALQPSAGYDLLVHKISCTTGAQCFNIIYINFMLQMDKWFPIWWTGKLNHGLTIKQFHEIINLKTVSVCKQSFNCVTNWSSTKQQRDTLQQTHLKIICADK
jgi:hypothetical protein